jgi:hypothetical protein
MQFNEGIDAVIVDNVLAVRKGLTSRGKANASASPASAPGTPAAVEVGDPLLAVKPAVATTINGVPIYENGSLAVPRQPVI